MASELDGRCFAPDEATGRGRRGRSGGVPRLCDLLLPNPGQAGDAGQGALLAVSSHLGPQRRFAPLSAGLLGGGARLRDRGGERRVREIQEGGLRGMARLRLQVRRCGLDAAATHQTTRCSPSSALLRGTVLCGCALRPAPRSPSIGNTLGAAGR